MFSSEIMSRLIVALNAQGIHDPIPSHSPVVQTDCIRRGAVVESVTCASCSGKVELKVFSCSVHGTCTIAKGNGDKAVCATCRDRRTDWPRQFNHYNLWPDVPGWRFNPSITEWAGGYAFCFRNGWKGCNLYCGFLDKDFEPVDEAIKLELHHHECDYGKEDPRLFVHKGKLHVAFAGVTGGSRIRRTSVLVARLGHHFTVESVTCPHLENRNVWEKNWSPLSHNNRLFMIYSIRPHRVLCVDDGKAEFWYEEPFDIPWGGGEWRGGAPPVLVGDHYWHFCHDRIEVNGLRTYRTLAYEFEAKPPFRPSRYVPEPLIVADPKDKPYDQYAAVTWVAGAVLTGGEWYLANGVHDRTLTIERFNHAELESRMVKIR